MDRLRYSSCQICRLAVVALSEGRFSNPIFRRAIGLIKDDINKEGKEGFFAKVNGIWYHIFYFVHGYCGDIVAAEQLYDRPGCHSSFSPCFQYNCVSLFYNLNLVRYTPSNMLDSSNPILKTICRAISQYPPSSIFRVLPAIAKFSNNSIICKPTTEKVDQILLNLLSQYTNVVFDDDQKAKIISMFEFCCSFGRSFYCHSPVDWNQVDMNHYVRDRSEDANLPMKDQRHLVNLDQNNCLPEENCYGVEMLHGLTNASNRIQSFICGTAFKAETISNDIYAKHLSEVMGIDIKTIDFTSFYVLPPSVLERATYWINQCHLIENQSWISPSSLLNYKRFKKLKSHQHMLYALCLFPYIYQDSMHIPFIRLSSYVFQLIGKLYLLDKNLAEAKRLQDLLNICLTLLQGQTVDNFITLAIHMFVHSYSTIENFGSLKRCDSMYFESSMKIEKSNNINSRNIMKTMEIRLLRESFYSIVEYYHSQPNQKTTFSGNSYLYNTPIWSQLFLQGNYKTLTMLNFQDMYCYYHFDVIPFPTTVDICRKQHYSLQMNYVHRGYFDERILNEIRWHDYPKIYKTVRYCGKYYYSYSIKNNTVVDNLSELPRYLAYNRGYDDTLHLYLVLGFMSVQIRGNSFIQAIVQEIPVFSIFTPVCTEHIVYLKKEDLLSASNSNLLIPLDSLYQNEGSLLPCSEDKYLFYTTMKVYFKSCNIMKNRELFEF